MKSNVNTLIIPHHYISSYWSSLCFLWVGAETEETVIYNWEGVLCDVRTETEKTDELRLSDII